MTTDLSKYDASKLPGADVIEHQRYAIIVADWNAEITYRLSNGALHTLHKCGVADRHIKVIHVPGTVELTYAAAKMMGASTSLAFASKTGRVSKTPVIFSVLTVDDKQQAKDRADGKLGNKGVEGAVTAIQMANLKK